MILIKLFSILAAAILMVACTKDINFNKDEVRLRIEGEISAKSLTEFNDALESIDKNHQKIALNAVQLNSRGGSGDIAREIGKIIRERKLNTYLARDADCASACVDILISGVERYAFGKVRVHRATFMHDTDRDDNIAQLISEAKKLNEDYVKSMGISLLLADAMDSTESWSIRQLTEQEKKQWQVFGVDRLAEELYFNQTARERFISRHEFIDIFKSNYEDCLHQAREFKQTVFDCAKSKKLKEPSYYIQFLKWLSTKLDSYIDADSTPLPFNEQVESLRKKIRDGKLYMRYTSITEVTDKKPKSSEKYLDDQLVERMEDANKWWIENNKLSVLVFNPTKSDLKEIVFELSSTDCKTEGGKKRLLSLPLHAYLEANNSAIYSGQLPFNYDKAIGKGTRCGVIKVANS